MFVFARFKISSHISNDSPSGGHNGEYKTYFIQYVCDYVEFLQQQEKALHQQPSDLFQPIKITAHVWEKSLWVSWKLYANLVVVDRLTRHCS